MEMRFQARVAADVSRLNYSENQSGRTSAATGMTVASQPRFSASAGVPRVSGQMSRVRVNRQSRIRLARGQPEGRSRRQGN